MSVTATARLERGPDFLLRKCLGHIESEDARVANVARSPSFDPSGRTQIHCPPCFSTVLSTVETCRPLGASTRKGGLQLAAYEVGHRGHSIGRQFPNPADGVVVVGNRADTATSQPGMMGKTASIIGSR